MQPRRPAATALPPLLLLGGQQVPAPLGNHARERAESPQEAIAAGSQWSSLNRWQLAEFSENRARGILGMGRCVMETDFGVFSASPLTLTDFWLDTYFRRDFQPSRCLDSRMAGGAGYHP